MNVWDWHVYQEHNVSDHNSIYFKIMVDTPMDREVWPWKTSNWGIFTDSLNKVRQFPDRMTAKKLDRELDLLYGR